MECKVQFVNEKVKKSFEELSNGNFEEKELKKHIERAFKDICKNHACGIQVPKRLIPKEYLKKYGVHNVYKYDLPNAYRLLYSVENTTIFILSIILEWLDHKEYERRFQY